MVCKPRQNKQVVAEAVQVARDLRVDLFGLFQRHQMPFGPAADGPRQVQRRPAR